MIWRAVLPVFVLFAVTVAADARTITDSAGRSVSIPDRITRVFAAGPPTSVVIYALAPHTLLGWPRALRREERAYIAEPFRDLPETGRLTGRGGEANLEYVVKLAPDLIIDFGSTTATYRSLADRVQEQTGIPYILIDGRFEATPAALRLLGDILGVGARGEELARYVEATFAEIEQGLADVDEKHRPRVYLARGPDGLETGLKGSINTEIIERAGGINVADASDGRKGLVRASIEQVIVANPDTIITWEPENYALMLVDPLWAGIDAVKRGRVYLSPTAPFGWIDRPPSVNRVMGLKWLSRVLYPDRFSDDIRPLTREFYRLFYGVELSEDELEGLIQWARGRAPARQ